MEAAEYLLKLSTFTLIGIDVLILIICIIGTRVVFLKRQLTDLRIKMAINQREEAWRHQLLVKQIQQQKGNNALDDLQHLFADKIKKLKHQYPALTETDIQVVTLIGLGVSNTDILQLADMSKRTYYKRRQLIAQRMNTTAAQLDQIAQNAFTSNTK
jgi:hypothetical protein